MSDRVEYWASYAAKFGTEMVFECVPSCPAPGRDGRAGPEMSLTFGSSAPYSRYRFGGSRVQVRPPLLAVTERATVPSTNKVPPRRRNVRGRGTEGGLTFDASGTLSVSTCPPRQSGSLGVTRPRGAA